jgi:hypothetical protein
VLDKVNEFNLQVRNGVIVPLVSSKGSEVVDEIYEPILVLLRVDVIKERTLD